MNGVDLEILFKYMPVGVMPKNSSNDLSSSGPFGYRTRYHQINFVNALKQTFGEKDALDVMLTNLKEQGFSFVTVSELVYTENYSLDHTGKQFLNKKE